MSSTQAQGSPVYAAGALVWRQVGEVYETLVIHRALHGDYSLPKGKVDDGETLPETAVREVWEETGLRVALGAPLSKVEYVLPNGRPKEVRYWSCEVTREQWESHAFEPNDEVASFEWMPLERAENDLTYVRDQELVAEFRNLVERDVARTFPVIALRHAKAVPRHGWTGEDDSRPLTSRGQAQASQVAPILAAYAPEAIISSTAVRCLATVAPFAQQFMLTPVSERILSQSVSPGEGEIAELVAGSLASGVGTVFCSHSPVIPELVDAIARLTGTPTETLSKRALLSTSESTIFHLQGKAAELKLVAAETFGTLI